MSPNWGMEATRVDWSSWAWSPTMVGPRFSWIILSQIKIFRSNSFNYQLTFLNVRTNALRHNASFIWMAITSLLMIPYPCFCIYWWYFPITLYHLQVHSLHRQGSIFVKNLIMIQLPWLISGGNLLINFNNYIPRQPIYAIAYLLGSSIKHFLSPNSIWL